MDPSAIVHVVLWPHTDIFNGSGYINNIYVYVITIPTYVLYIKIFLKLY